MQGGDGSGEAHGFRRDASPEGCSGDEAMGAFRAAWEVFDSQPEHFASSQLAGDFTLSQLADPGQ